MAVLYLVTFLAAACSLVYEFLIAQAVSFYAGNTVAWYSLVVGTYLAAMGFGSYLSIKRPVAERPWRSLLGVELALALLGTVSVLLIHGGYLLQVHALANGLAVLGFLSFFPLVVSVVIGIGILVGFEIPLIISIAGERQSGENIANRILAVDYLGCLAGSALFPLALLPRLELHSIGFLTGFVNALLAIIVLNMQPGRASRRSRALAAVCPVVCVFGLLGADPIEQYVLKRFYYASHFSSLKELLSGAEDLPRVERHSSAYQKLDFVTSIDSSYSEVVRDAYSTKFAENPSLPADTLLFINGDLQFNAAFEEFYHEWFAHVPIIRSGSVPKKVLVVGGGDGLLLREILKYRAIASVLVVEIVPVIVSLAKTHPTLTALNQNSFTDPRVTVVYSDGYPFMRANDERFDAIYLDLPHASDYNLSRLYSREFYYFARRSLAPDGFIAQDANGIEDLSLPDEYGDQAVLPGNLWEYYYSTIREAGFDAVSPFFINLEPQNESAIATLAAHTGAGELNASPELVRQAALRFLRMHAYMLQMGFIFLQNRTSISRSAYWNPGVTLHALNAERFEAAFTFPFSSIKTRRQAHGKLNHAADAAPNAFFHRAHPAAPEPCGGGKTVRLFAGSADNLSS